jgi:uncharacterized membrane protein
MFPLSFLRSSLIENLQKKHPSVSPEGYICPKDMRAIRTERIQDLLVEDKGELSQLENEVLQSFEEHEILAENMNKKFEKNLTFGERLADKIAKFGGSWRFISIFIFIILLWMTINTVSAFIHPFDPYPYILLNLFLSCLAAIQAPIIMMSQNRQAARDKLQSDYEYTTNLKAELEIRQLHSKLDQFMKKHWYRLLEIQQIQIDLAEDLLEQNHKKTKDK